MEESQISSIMSTVNETHDQVMKITVLINSLTARLEAIEKIQTSNIVAPKRVIKVAPVQHDTDDIASVSSTGSKRKQLITNESNTVELPVINTEEKIVNALTFFKKIIMFKNYNGLRNKYSNSDMINTVKQTVKKPEGTESYWISIGNSIWKNLDKDQKKDVKEEFTKWKQIHQIVSDNSQLNEDEQDSN